MRSAYNHFRLGLTPQRILAFLFLIVLGYLVIVPLFLMVRETFIVHPLERFQIPGSRGGEWTTAPLETQFLK